MDLARGAVMNVGSGAMQVYSARPWSGLTDEVKSQPLPSRQQKRRRKQRHGADRGALFDGQAGGQYRAGGLSNYHDRVAKTAQPLASLDHALVPVVMVGGTQNLGRLAVAGQPHPQAA